MEKSTYRLGVLALLLSALLMAISHVFYANRVQAVHPFLFTGISFFITSLYFYLFTIKRPNQPKWSSAWKPLVKLNIASVLTFMSFYFALKYIEPAIVSSLEIGGAPLFILLLMLLKKKPIPSRNWAISLGTLIACLLLIVAAITGASGVDSQSTISTIFAIVLSIVCGIGAVFCSEYSKQLNELGWTSSMILSKRYIGIIIISFLFTYELIIPYFMGNIGWILLITIFGVLAPNYLLQKGIQYTNTFLVMMSLSFIPIFTLCFQLFDPRIDFSITTLIGVAILFICGLASLRK